MCLTKEYFHIDVDPSLLFLKRIRILLLWRWWPLILVFWRCREVLAYASCVSDSGFAFWKEGWLRIYGEIVVLFNEQLVASKLALSGLFAPRQSFAHLLTVIWTYMWNHEVCVCKACMQEWRRRCVWWTSDVESQGHQYVDSSVCWSFLINPRLIGV